MIWSTPGELAVITVVALVTGGALYNIRLRWRRSPHAYQAPRRRPSDGRPRPTKWRSTIMHETDSGAIEERLARLERRVKRTRRAATATMVLLASLIAWSVAARSGKAQAAGSGPGTS